MLRNLMLYEMNKDYKKDVLRINQSILRQNPMKSFIKLPYIESIQEIRKYYKYNIPHIIF